MPVGEESIKEGAHTRKLIWNDLEVIFTSLSVWGMHQVQLASNWRFGRGGFICQGFKSPSHQSKPPTRGYLIKSCGELLIRYRHVLCFAKVAVRARPLNSREKKLDCDIVVAWFKVLGISG